MNPKVTGIILLVIGLGIGLYFINSGGAAKVSSIVAVPSAATSSAPSVTSTSSTTATSSSGFSWNSFFASLFPPMNFNSLTSGLPASSGSGSNSQTTTTSGSSEVATSTVTPPAGYTVSQLSPYYQQVRFGGVSSYEISLVTSPTYGEPTSTVDVTGWEIKTNRGGEFIPQAENLYYPIGVAAESDIILSLNENEYVNIFSNSSPANLRINSCLGYLNTPQQFNPGFSNDCPTIDRSQITQFTGACQNYIMSLGSCQSPDFTSYNFPQNDYQCENYLQGKYNYNWCVSTYSTSPYFFTNEWRVWMGSTPLDPYHDNVALLDNNGLLVDSYSY